MNAPWLQPPHGASAARAAALCAGLPVLQTARLTLRAPWLGDFEAWAEVLCGPAGPWLGGPFDRDAAFVEFTASVGLWLLRGHGVWTVEARPEGTVLGFVLIGFEPGDTEPELGFLFRPAAEGQGYATEAATAARAHAQDVLRLGGLVSYVAPGNHRSSALAQRLGARRDRQAEAALGDGTLVYRHFGPGTAQ